MDVKGIKSGVMGAKSKECWMCPFCKFDNFKSRDTCKKCDYFKSCRGGDRSRAYVTSGTLTDPDPLCLIASRAGAHA